MNDSRRTGILRLRHLREASEAHAEEMAEHATRFARLKNPGAAPRVVSAFNLFQTPEPLARRLAGMFDRFGVTLEPSAGLGRLYRAVREVAPDARITLVDNSPECVRELYRETDGDREASLISGDFLQKTAEELGGPFDSIVMNPPFKMGTDVKHILHARAMLAPGGRLVSLCAAGPRQRAALQPIADQWIDLPAGSFRSEGTGVESAIVVFNAREEAAPCRS